MKKPSFSIRLALPEDVIKLGPIECSAATIFRSVGLDWLDDGDTMDPAVLERLCRDGTLWIATDEQSEPVGFLAAYELDGDFYVAELSVAQSHQRRGLGSKLMGEAAAYARVAGFGALTLTTYRDLEWNGAFYARLGFVEVQPAEAGSGLQAKLQSDIDAGHDPARRCIMALRLC